MPNDNSRLLELIELVSRKIHRQLHPLAEAESVSLPELFVLRKIAARGTCRVTEIAADIGIPPSTLTGITDRLVSKELLVRSRDPKDRRAVVLEPGAALPELLKRVQSERERRMAKIFAAVKPESIERLIGVLEELLAGLEREEENLQ